MFIHRWATHDLWNLNGFKTRYECSIINCIDRYVSYCACIIIIKIQIQEKETHSVLNMLIGLELFLEHMNMGNIKLASKRLKNKWQMWLTKNETVLAYLFNFILFMILLLLNGFYHGQQLT